MTGMTEDFLCLSGTQFKYKLSRNMIPKSGVEDWPSDHRSVICDFKLGSE